MKLFPYHEGDSTKNLAARIAEKYPNDPYVNGRFIQTVRHYDRLARHDGSVYLVTQNAAIVFAGLTTFFIGIAALWMKLDSWLKAASLVTSLIATALASLLRTLNYQDKTIAYRALRESLTTEFYRFDMEIAPYSPTGDVKVFATNVENMLDAANKEWSILRKAPNENGS
jgi:hypothetical protein